MTKNIDPTFTGDVEFSLTYFAKGGVVEKKIVGAKFTKGKTRQNSTVISKSLDTLGYVELGVTAEKPIFSAPHCGSGYAIFERKNGDYITINNDTKFSHYRVIQQMKTWSQYCLVHTSVACSSTNNIGNSFLLINAYQRPILVKISGGNSRVLRKKIEPQESTLISLSELIENNMTGTVFLTGNNRLVAYDVKHSESNKSEIFNVDHLDVFSGEKTWHEGLSDNISGYKRAVLRKIIGRNF